MPIHLCTTIYNLYTLYLSKKIEINLKVFHSTSGVNTCEVNRIIKTLYIEYYLKGEVYIQPG